MDTQDVLAVVAAIAGPSCAWLAWLVRLLYADLKACHERYEALLRETLTTLASLDLHATNDGE